MTDALQVRSVSVLRGKRTVVRDVTFAAAYGSVTAIVGPNGAGKSSLLRALNGLLPHHGSILVQGEEVRQLAIPERARRIGYVPQHTQLSADLTVREVVAQARFAHSRAWQQPDLQARPIARALEEAHVSGLAERPYNRLSGGEQRRVLLARALATEAKILLLDEPTAGVDLAHVLRFHALVRGLAERGLAVISVLHDLLDVYHHADRALLLSRGELALEGPAADVIRSVELSRVYGVRAHSFTPPFELVP